MHYTVLGYCVVINCYCGVDASCFADRCTFIITEICLSGLLYMFLVLKTFERKDVENKLMWTYNSSHANISKGYTLLLKIHALLNSGLLTFKIF